jgi:hypothetical protein
MKTEKYWSDSLVSLEILGLTKSMNGWSAKPPEKKFRWLKMRKMWCMVLVQDEPGIAAGFSHSFLQLGASTKDFAEAMRKIEIALRNAELQKKGHYTNKHGVKMHDMVKRELSPSAGYQPKSLKNTNYAVPPRRK